MPDRHAPTSTLLAIRAGSTSWSVPGAAVSGVERLSDWAGPPPLDVLALLGAPTASADDEARIILLQANQQQLPLLALGTLSLLHTTPEQLLELPAALRQSAPLIHQIAVVDGSAALFVLSPHGLLEAWQRPPATSALPPCPR